MSKHSGEKMPPIYLTTVWSRRDPDLWRVDLTV